jgi:hypothetical protein
MKACFFFFFLDDSIVTVRSCWFSVIALCFRFYRSGLLFLFLVEIDNSVLAISVNELLFAFFLATTSYIKRRYRGGG